MAIIQILLPLKNYIIIFYNFTPKFKVIFRVKNYILIKFELRINVFFFLTQFRQAGPDFTACGLGACQ